MRGLQQTLNGLSTALTGLNAEFGTGGSRIAAFSNALAPVQPLLAGIAAAGVATTAAVVGLGVAATDAAVKYQAAGAQLQGTTQMSNEELQKLSDMFLDTAGSSQFSAQQQMQASAQVMGSLKLQGGATLDAANAFAVEQTAEKLAIATHSDLNTATNVLVSTMKANNIAIGDADQAFTILTNTSKLMGTSVQDAGSALNRLHGLTGAPIADIAALGVAVSQTGEGMSGMLVGGIIRLSTVLTNLEDPTKNTRKALADLGVQVAHNADGSLDLITTFQRLHDAEIRVGEATWATDSGLLVAGNDLGLFNTMVKEGGGQLQFWKDQITDSNSALNQYNKNNDTAQANLNKVKAALQDMLIIIGNAFLPLLQQWLQNIIPIVATTAQWIQANGEFVASLLIAIAKIGLLVAAAALFLSILPTIAAAIGLLISPFGLVVVAITAVATGIVKLPEVFASALSATLQVVATIVSEIVELLSFLDPTSHHSPSMVEKVASGSGQIKDHYQKLGTHMVNQASDFKQVNKGTLGLTVADPVQADFMKRGVQDVAKEHAGLVDQMDDHGDSLKKIRQDKISHIDPLARHSPSLLDNIQSGFAQIGDAIDNVRADFETLNEVPTILDGISQAVSNADSATSSFVTKVDDFANKFQEALITKMQKAVTALGGGGDGLVGAFQSAETEINKLNGFIDTLNTSITALTPQVNDAKKTMDDWANTVEKDNENIQAITAKIQPLQEKLTDLQNQLSAIQDGTASAVSGLQQQVDAAQQAYQNADFTLQQLNATLQTTKTQIDNAKSAMQDLLNTTVLPGQNTYDQQQFDLGEKIKSAQLDLVNAKIAAGGVDNDQTKALQQQVDLLNLQSQQLQIQRDLQTDPQKRQLQIAQQGGLPTEMPYDQLLAQVTAYGTTIKSLTPTLNSQTDAYNAQKAVVDGLKATYDNLNHQLEQLKQQLEQPIKIQIDQTKASLEPLNKQLKDAQDKLKADEDQLKDATKKYDELKAQLQAEITLRDKLKAQRDQEISDLKAEVDILVQLAQAQKNKAGGGGRLGGGANIDTSGIKGLDPDQINQLMQHLKDMQNVHIDPKFAANLDSIKGSLTSIGSALQPLNTLTELLRNGVNPANALAAALAQMYEHLTGKHIDVSQIQTFLQNLASVARVALEVIAVFAAVNAAFALLGGVLTAVGTIIGTVGQVIGLLFAGFDIAATVIPTVVGFFILLGETIAAVVGAIVGVLSLPVLAIAALVAAVIAAVVMIILHWQQLLNFFTQVVPVKWKQLMDLIDSGLQTMSGWFTQTWTAVQALLQQVWDAIVQLVGEAFDHLGTNIHLALIAIQLDWNNVWQGMQTFLSGLWDMIVSTVGEAFDHLGTNFHTKLVELQLDWNTIWNSFTDTITSVWTGIKSAVQSGINNVIDLINGFIRSIDGLSISWPGGSWHPSINEIPHVALAEGGIVTDPTLALIGEAGPEAVIPLSGAGGFGTNITIMITGNYILDDATGQRLATKVYDVLTQRLGQTIIPGAGIYTQKF